MKSETDARLRANDTDREDWNAALKLEREQLQQQRAELAVLAEQLSQREQMLQPREQQPREPQPQPTASSAIEQTAAPAENEDLLAVARTWTPVGQRSAAELLAEQATAESETLAAEQRARAEQAHEERRRGWLTALETAADDATDQAPDQPMEPVPPARQASAEVDEDHEASISAYMSRLLDRAGAGRGTRAAPASQAPPPPAVPATPAGQPEVEVAAESEAIVPAERVVKPLPASLTDMTNMRELANMNSRLAIDKAFRKQVLKTTNNKAIVLVVSLLSGLLLLFWGLEGVSYAMVGGVVSLIISTIWGVQYLLLARHLFGPGSEQWETDEPEQEELPETDSLEPDIE